MDKKEKFITNYVLDDGSIVEMIFRPEYKDTRLLSYKDGQTKLWEKIELDDVILAPYPPNMELIDKKVILFPSGIDDYSSEKELIDEIGSFIYKYLDISPTFETIAIYYVLLTYLYDRLPNILYLRFIGDFGSGKSRALKVIGSLCYRPMVATGAITTSVLFRIIDKFNGTLVLDEADFNNSDTYAEIVKILNSGYEAGKAVLRSEGDNKNNWDVRAFNCYCPKIIATRNNFKDLALESRCLTEVMAKNQLREDIPLNLPKDFEEEALKLRNKLLSFRFKNYNNSFALNSDLDKEIEPRLRQITNIMFSIINDDSVKDEIKSFILNYHRELISDRGLGFEGKIVEALYNLSAESEVIAVKDLTNEYNRIREGDKELSSSSVGRILKSKLQINTRHTRQGRIISETEKDRIGIIFKNYGFSVNLVNLVKDDAGVAKEEIK
ncbi:MAG: hypothetical protein PHE49_09540 [bacterium]|nr:hypothetical protein [bacterium]